MKIKKSDVKPTVPNGKSAHNSVGSKTRVFTNKTLHGDGTAKTYSKVVTEGKARKSGQDTLPLLIPVVSEGDYNLSKKIGSSLYLKENYSKLYHVWLDCLYFNDVTFEDIVEELRPLFGSAISRHVSFNESSIFIKGQKMEDGSTQVSGSCYILITNRAVTKLGNIDLRILDVGLHMMRSSVPAIREQIKNEPILIFRNGHRELVSEIPEKALLKACKKTFPDYFVGEISQSKDQTQTINLKNSIEPNTNGKEIMPSQCAQLENDKEPKLIEMNRDIANSKLEYYSKEGYDFIQFRISGYERFNLHLLRTIFSPREVDWRDVYITSDQTHRTGIIGFKKGQSVKNNCKKGSQTFDINGKLVTATLCSLMHNTYGSILKNFKQTRMYSVKQVSAKRKKFDSDVVSSPRVKRPSVDDIDDFVVQMRGESEYLQLEESPKKLVIDEVMSTSSMNTNVDSPDYFVPLTTETLSYATNIVYRMSKENRLVFVTFDQCFTNPNLNIDDINNKYSSICGQIEENCVMIKSSLEKLTPDIKTAYQKEFKRLPQAIIITPKGIDRFILDFQAKQNNIMCSITTFSCIVMNLKKNTYLMSRKALLGAGVPEASLTQAQIESPVNKVRKKMMANLNRPKQLEVKKEIIPNSYPPDEFEKMLKGKVEEDTKRGDFVSELLPRLISCGNVVFKVQQIPGHLTVRDLNSLLGTKDIEHNQVICANYEHKKGESIMNARVILRQGSPDIERITKQNNIMAPGLKVRMSIAQSDIKELEVFLATNYSRLVRLRSRRNPHSTGRTYTEVVSSSGGAG